MKDYRVGDMRSSTFLNMNVCDLWSSYINKRIKSSRFQQYNKRAVGWKICAAAQTIGFYIKQLFEATLLKTFRATV